MTRLIQITDSHLQADPKARCRTGHPLSRFEQVLKYARRQQPDAVILTGDIGENGSPGAYRLAVERLDQLGCPWYWLAGNHDDPEVMARHRSVVDEIELDRWRLLMLNTQVIGESFGKLGEAQLKRLAVRLRQDERPTWLVMHHPPVTIDSAWMDAIGLQDRQALWQCLERFPQVRGILCGHIHQAFTQTVVCSGGKIAVHGCPATSDQFLPRSDAFAVDEQAMPGYRVVELEDAGFTTWVERVETQKKQ
ncbi:metallophosphoesterase [Pistricoccus aurantiacus]|uniref:metallophosphoesterase n=1 Tax=Pistricoccus aurantiacus TaxID=1883414 RepID=UPI0036455497